MALLCFPIMLLNMFGWIIAGIWLAMGGNWQVIIAGALGSVPGSYLISFALMPGLMFSASGMMTLERRRFVTASVLLVLGQAWTYLIMGAWCLLVFFYIGKFYRGGPTWPFLLWSYGMAAGIWSYNTSDTRSIESPFHVLVACIVSLTIVGAIMLTGTTAALLTSIAVPLILGFIVQSVLTLATTRAVAQIEA